MSDFKKVGIIIADEDEFKPLAERVCRGEFTESALLKRRVLNFKAGKAEITAVHCGIGKVNAAAAAAYLAAEGIEIMLNYGLSGGISGVVRGDICVCNRFSEHDFDLTGLGYRPCEKPGQTYIYKADEKLTKLILSQLPGAVTGAAVTGDCFVSDPKLREFLKTEFNTACCDMETAAVAYVCEYAGIPFACVRRISDDAGADAATSYREMNTFGNVSLSELIIKIAALAAES